MTTSPRLPQLDAALFLTDGGLETTLIFHDGFELLDFAAFMLLRDPQGRDALVKYFDGYAEIAERDGVGIVLETPTWRARGDRCGPGGRRRRSAGSRHLLHRRDRRRAAVG